MRVLRAEGDVAVLRVSRDDEVTEGKAGRGYIEGKSRCEGTRGKGGTCPY